MNCNECTSKDVCEYRKMNEECLKSRMVDENSSAWWKDFVQNWSGWNSDL